MEHNQIKQEIPARTDKMSPQKRSRRSTASVGSGEESVTAEMYTPSPSPPPITNDSGMDPLLNKLLEVVDSAEFDGGDFKKFKRELTSKLVVEYMRAKVEVRVKEVVEEQSKETNPRIENLEWRVTALERLRAALGDCMEEAIRKLNHKVG